ncbi:thiamine pyrophosphate-binding protein [Glaciimonas sp. GG7]
MNKIISGSGGQILVNCLITHGVDHVFCVPGESYLNVLDALYDVRDQIALRICRHESGAANMADAYGKLTGKPGIVMVTRGPGAMNAAIGIHTAHQDSTPLIMFIGQVARTALDREAFQECDYRRVFGSMTKWVAQCDDPKRLPEYISRAFHTAVSGRPGPVVLALPEDMLTELAEACAAPPYQRIASAPTPASLQQLSVLLSAAQRPIAILGGSGWTSQACAEIRQFAQAWQLPIACAFRFQDLFDNTDPLYAGDVGIGINPALAHRIKNADVVLAIGPRLGEMTTSGYTLFDIPTPQQRLVHVHAGAEELGSVYAAELAINAGMPEFSAAVAKLARHAAIAWIGEAEIAHAEYLLWNTPPQVAGPVQMGQIMEYLRTNLPADAIICNGAGNYATWVHRFYHYRHFKSQLAPTSGAMGYGVPAAIAAKSLYPHRMVIAFAGDGCFMMSSNELATAMQYALPVIFVVVNNGIYGTIRMHQEREYPTRVHGTGLTNPDFAAYARAFGAFGVVVEKTEDFVPAFEQACASGKPAVIEIRLSPEIITPGATLTDIREQALRKQVPEK